MDVRESNQPLDNWNVSSVQDTRSMFEGCSAFNQSLNNWVTSSLINADSMFSDCVSFNQPLDNWDVSNIIAMRYMFAVCSSFNQDLSNLTFPKVEPHNRNSYDLATFAWQESFKPSFAILA